MRLVPASSLGGRSSVVVTFVTLSTEAIVGAGSGVGIVVIGELVSSM